MAASGKQYPAAWESDPWKPLPSTEAAFVREVIESMPEMPTCLVAQYPSMQNMSSRSIADPEEFKKITAKMADDGNLIAIHAAINAILAKDAGVSQIVVSKDAKTADAEKARAALAKLIPRSKDGKWFLSRPSHILCDVAASMRLAGSLGLPPYFAVLYHYGPTPHDEHGVPADGKLDTIFGMDVVRDKDTTRELTNFIGPLAHWNYVKAALHMWNVYTQDEPEY